MKRRGKKSGLRRVIDMGIYCIAVILLFFAVILVLQEVEYVPEDVYYDPPPARTANAALTPNGTPAPTYIPFYPSQAIVETSSPNETDSTSESSPPDKTETGSIEEPWYDENMLRPVKLYFIDRKISCEIQPVTLNGKNKMDTIRSAHKAGWLYTEPYVLPGDVGKSVIAGHNRWGGKNGTFSVLKKLEVGDKIAVEMSDGYSRYFKVDSISECAHDDNTVMEPVYDKPVLILITCKGDWSNVLHTSKTRVIATCSPQE